MGTFVINQTQTFFIFILFGGIIGLLFDVFRILRKSFKTPDIITYIEDILFWLLTCIILAFAIFYYNNGEFRFYLLIGLAIGLLLYILCFSKFIVKTSVNIITTIKKIVISIFEIIKYPLKLFLTMLRRILFKPISFVFINIRKSISINIKKFGKLLKKKLIERRI